MFLAESVASYIFTWTIALRYNAEGIFSSRDAGEWENSGTSLPALSKGGQRGHRCPVAKPAQKFGRGQKNFGEKMLHFRQMTLFCFGHRLLKHKMTTCSENLVGWPPRPPPGYAYGGAFFITVSWVISWFIEIELKQI